jgi:hypothetical protein
MFGLPAGEALWWANEVRTYSLFLLAVAALIAIVASWTQLRMQDVLSAEKDEAVRQDQLEAETQIAGARTEAEKAREAAAHAGAEAAKANEGAARANAVAAKAAERAAALENEAAQARVEHERLKTQLAWRALTPETVEKLKAGLAASRRGTVLIAYTANDPEALMFAIQIREAFSDSGNWEVRAQARTFGRAVTFEVHIPGPDNDIVVGIRNAFKAADINFHTAKLPPPDQPTTFRGKAPEATIMVGSKPPPF